MRDRIVSGLLADPCICGLVAPHRRDLDLGVRVAPYESRRPGFLGGVPEMLFEDDASFVVELHALGTQPFLHDARPLEVPLSGQRTESIDHAVARKCGSRRRLQRPSHGARGTAYTEVLRDSSVRRNLAVRDLGHDVPHTLEEVA